MNLHELHQMRKAQRRDLAAIALAGAVLVLLAHLTQPDPLPVPTGAGFETCKPKEC